MIRFPFVARAYAAQLEAENLELRRRLSAGGIATQRKARSRVLSKTAQLRAELNMEQLS